MNTKLPFQQAGALLVGAALIGVGATRLDLASLVKNHNGPPDDGARQGQEPRRLVLPEPKFGDLKIDPVPNRLAAPAAMAAAGSGAASRPHLMTSASDGALATSAPTLSDWEQSIAADIAKTFKPTAQDYPGKDQPHALPDQGDQPHLQSPPHLRSTPQSLPTPLFGMAQDQAQQPELFANNDFNGAFSREDTPLATLATPDQPLAGNDASIGSTVPEEYQYSSKPAPIPATENAEITDQGEIALANQPGELEPILADTDGVEPEPWGLAPQGELPLPATLQAMQRGEDIDAAIAPPAAANDNLDGGQTAGSKAGDIADLTFEGPISFGSPEPELTRSNSATFDATKGANIGPEESAKFAAVFIQDQSGTTPSPTKEIIPSPGQGDEAENIEFNGEFESFKFSGASAAPPAVTPPPDNIPPASPPQSSETSASTVPIDAISAGATPPIHTSADDSPAGKAAPEYDHQPKLAQLAPPRRIPSGPSQSITAPGGTGFANTAPISAETSIKAISPTIQPQAQPTAQPTAQPAARLPASDALQSANAALIAPGEGRSTLDYGTAPNLSFQDELILDLRVKGFDASDTILAFGTRDGIYLPLGTMSRILDLAIVVSDNGHYAAGWAISRDRTLTLDLRNRVLIINGQEQPLPPALAIAFDGELYLRADQYSNILPLTLAVDLRQQAIVLETLEPFPFQERLKREANRARLASRQLDRSGQEWPREETPWELASVPLADLELRTISDSARGERLEGDVRISGDLAFLTAQAFLGADTKSGLTTSLVEFGRTDPDAQLLGPLKATEFAFGDISTVSLPIGLRGVVGRGVSFTNYQPEAASVFESIDLRGILPDGYEVELYRNDILIGSTIDAQNGQYEFLQVPVDFGLNIFRLVFFGPQGQRREEVRRIMVGDGRLSPGHFRYRFNAAQKDENLFGVRDPFFLPADDFGDWRVTGELSYGISSAITATASGAWFETPEGDRWTLSGGLRTGVGQFAIKGDIAFADNNGFAIGGGIGGRLGNSTFTLDHIEYSGDFIDETKAIGRQFLRRSTELDFNTTLNLGDPITGLIIPITGRARHFETAEGRKQTNAALRASTRFSSLLASNTLEYSRSSFPQLAAFSQLFGNFDLATLGRSKLRTRASLGYQIVPDPDLVSVGFEADYAIDHRTAIRGQISYAFQTESTQLGLSAVREFDRFTLAFDSTYGLRNDNYSFGLRLATSFGRNPRDGRFFLARPGLSSMGAASLRAFHDLDGDGTFGPGDRPIPDAEFVAFNQTARTDESGTAFLGGLSQGRRVTLQLDPTSLPDIALAPASKGVEIIPRPGRIHQSDFAVVALSEVDGNVTFQQGDSSRGVSGVRLELRDAAGNIAGYSRSEIDGYYFFEQIRPGTYQILIDKDQAERLNLCLAGEYPVKIGNESDIFNKDITIVPCQVPPPQSGPGGQ